MYKLFRSLLFQLPPETAHQLTLGLMRVGSLQPFNSLLRMMYAVPEKPVEAFGLKFKNPVGLAAGYDKDGIAVRGLAALGFGHIEVGTVTPHPQPGNPKPRLFRLVEDEAIINRMGFPGKGAAYVSDQLSVVSSNRPPSSVLGLNLGKNKNTPLEEAARDYISLMETFSPRADYLAINVSSPNTVGLRRLQGREMLENLLQEIAKMREPVHESIREAPNRNSVNSALSVVKPPVLVKLAPDLTDDELEDAVGVILDCGMDGIIATNTTLSREGLESAYRAESGGLSGSPLRVRSEAMLAKIVRRVAGKVPVVSIGGIMTPQDAKRRLDMGAALVQIYTGLIYRGPGLVKEIVRAI